MDKSKKHDDRKIEITCKICDKQILIPPCFADIRKYCSKECKYIGIRKIRDKSIRQCNGCHKILPLLTGFYKSNNKHEYRCKECSKKRSRKDAKSDDGRFRCAKHIAKRRDMEWGISKVEYLDLIRQPCHYCDRQLNPTGTGLDRKENKIGYITGNVVPCCCACNTARSDNFSYDEMLILSKTIKSIIENRKI